MAHGLEIRVPFLDRDMLDVRHVYISNMYIH